MFVLKSSVPSVLSVTLRSSNVGAHRVSILIKVEDASFPSGGSTIGANPALSKSDTGRGNGPLPLGGSGLMEEMSALLARR